MSETPAISAETASKLGKLVRRLRSDRDGERLATITAIERTLASANLDLNDFADAVEALGAQAARPVYTFNFDAGAHGPQGTHRGTTDSATGGDRWHRQRDQARARQRDRENNGPRWRDLTRSGALAWLDAILHELRADEPRVQINGDTADLVHRVRKRLWHTPHRGATSHEAQRLTRAIRAAWREGVRPE